jgi:hypothetical protein
VCQVPPQSVNGSLHITASNDGSVFSAPPLVTAKGAGSFLLYSVVDARPWGQWALVNSTFPAQVRASGLRLSHDQLCCGLSSRFI